MFLDLYVEILFLVPTINLLYAVAGLALCFAGVVLLWDYKFNAQTLYIRFIERYVLWLILLLTWGGLVTTLFYSEVLGFIPCSLCWLQRVALYPQAFLSIAALRVRDRVYFPLYGMILSVFGFIVAIYQFIYQSLPAEALESGLVPCLADGSADCSKKVMEVFGFVTFPLLSAFIFFFLFVLYLHLRRRSR